MDLLDHFFFLICYNPERNEAILWQAKFQKTTRNMDVGYYCTHSTQLQVEVEGTVLFREEDMHFESYRIQMNRRTLRIIFLGKYRHHDIIGSLMPVVATCHYFITSLQARHYFFLRKTDGDKIWRTWVFFIPVHC